MEGEAMSVVNTWTQESAICASNMENLKQQAVMADNRKCK
jgi:hypothetical protein